MYLLDQEAGVDGETEDGSASEQAATKQAPKKRPPKKTVEQNLSNINLSESEMKCEVKNAEFAQDPTVSKPLVSTPRAVTGGPHVPAHGCVFRREQYGWGLPVRAVQRGQPLRAPVPVPHDPAALQTTQLAHTCTAHTCLTLYRYFSTLNMSREV